MPQRKAPKTFNLKNKLIAHIRKCFQTSPWPHLCRLKVKQGKTYQCVSCKQYFESITVDHKIPVVDPKTGFVDWNTYISRMFCSLDNLQTLCGSCDESKRKDEENERKLHGTGRWSKASRRAQGKSISENEVNNERLRQHAIKNALKPRTDKQKAAAKLPKPELHKPVIATNLSSHEIRTYESAFAAAKDLDFIYTNVAKVCRGERNKVGEWKFEYRND